MGVPYGDRGYPPPHGLAPLKPTVSPRGRRGAHPRLHLGVLALPGDGGHLTDFVANLWSIGALGGNRYYIRQAQPKPLVLKPTAGAQGSEMSFPPLCSLECLQLSRSLVGTIQ